MLAIRMQRTGRKGHAQFRVIVQDSRMSPTSGRVVAQLGSYNPHTKDITLDKEKASFYLENGAQPSDRTARLLQKEGVKLPEWVTVSAEAKRSVRNPEKLRKNRPAEPKPEEGTEQSAESKEVIEPVAEAAEAEATTEPETAAEHATEEAPKVEAAATETSDDNAAEDSANPAEEVKS